MTRALGLRSTRHSLAATLAACLCFSLTGCGGSNAGVHVLRESEELRHLPAGTRVQPPGTDVFTLARPEGAWLVDAGYLSRVHELLGMDTAHAE